MFISRLFLRYPREAFCSLIYEYDISMVQTSWRYYYRSAERGKFRHATLQMQIKKSYLKLPIRLAFHVQKGKNRDDLKIVREFADEMIIHLKDRIFGYDFFAL